MSYLGENPKSSVGELRLLLDSKANSSHGHDISSVSGLQAVLSNKTDTGHGHAIADVSGLQAVLDTKVNEDYVSNAVSAVSIADASTTVAGKVMLASVADLTSTDKAVTPAILASGLGGKANTSHSHDISNVSGLQAALDSKASTADISNALGGYTPSTASVLLANAGATFGAVGTYAKLYRITAYGYGDFTALNANDNVPGSSLGFYYVFPNIDLAENYTAFVLAGVQSGTWKVMSGPKVEGYGTNNVSNVYDYYTEERLYLRIA